MGRDERNHEQFTFSRNLDALEYAWQVAEEVLTIASDAVAATTAPDTDPKRVAEENRAT
jgi:hypothetical protein